MLIELNVSQKEDSSMGRIINNISMKTWMGEEQFSTKATIQELWREEI